MSENKPASRNPSHRLLMIVGEGENIKAIQVGDASPGNDGRTFELRLDAVFEVIVVPTGPIVLF